REVNARRVWFAEALLASNQDEGGRLLGRAREVAERLGKPVRLWMADKQDVLVKAIARVFPGVPHRYGQNHFLRDLAKPMLKADSHAKVQMPKKVRGLRAVEREALGQRQRARAPAQAGGGFTPRDPGPRGPARTRGGGTAAARQSG